MARKRNGRPCFTGPRGEWSGRYGNAKRFRHTPYVYKPSVLVRQDEQKRREQDAKLLERLLKKAQKKAAKQDAKQDAKLERRRQRLDALAAVLKPLFDAGARVLDMAAKLDKSESQTKRLLSSLGLKRPSGRPRKARPTDINLTDNCNI